MDKFWENKTLFEMTPEEWESLCDGCGLCCLHKVEDEDTGEFFLTNVHCKLFNPKTCQCKSYAKRKRFVSDCQALTPKKVSRLGWLPRTCAYRLLSEDKPLPQWHPLITGSKKTTHKNGHTPAGRSIISEESLKSMDDLIDYVVEEPWATSLDH